MFNSAIKLAKEKDILVEKDGYYKMSKKHGDVHGLGLSNIDKMLKNNATLTLNHTDNIFELGFILPFKEA